MTRRPSYGSIAVLSSLSALAFTGLAAAQTPFVPRATVWVTDSSNDRVALARDLDYDGDYDDAGEVVVFYDDTLGAYALGNNNTIESRADGTLLVGDTSSDVVLTLADLNGDGDAHDFNEATAYFQSGAVAMPSVNGVFADGDVVWVANAQSGTTGKDTILRLEDTNANGTAQDAGEAIEYYVSSDLSIGGAGGDSLPMDVAVGLDLNVYYLDSGSTGVIAKGIYQLVDADQSGAIDPTEVTAYFIPPALANTAFFWALEQDSAGYWYLADTGNDLIWRGRDLDASGAVDAAEMAQWWVSPAASTVWELHAGADGELYVSESQNNERIFAMRDLDQNGSIDPVNEVKTLYDELSALGAAIGQIRGFALDAKSQAPSSIYCTAQVNTLLCTPATSWEGWPSAGYGSGYVIRATNVRSQVNGIFFYGLSGRVSAPFNGGTMCVALPRVRTPIQSSQGSAGGFDCTGEFEIDFNVYIASGVDPALVAGVVVDGQHWSRDPGSVPGNTNLTDAIEFCIGL